MKKRDEQKTLNRKCDFSGEKNSAATLFNLCRIFSRYKLSSDLGYAGKKIEALSQA